MARYDKREYRLGDYWLSQKPGSPAWFRTSYDKQARQTRRVSLHTDDFEKAKRLLDEWWATQRLVMSRNLPPQEVTLKEVFDEYLLNHAVKLRSYATIKHLINYWLDWWGPKATVLDVRDMIRQERFREHLEVKKKLRPNSINRCLEFGRAALNRGYRRGILAFVPYVQCLSVDNSRKMGDQLSVRELNRLYWLGSSEPHYRLYFLLAMATGGRPGAITDLTWAQVDWEANTIDLNPPGRKQTSKRRAKVKLPPALREVLEDLPRDTPRVLMFRGRTMARMVSVWPKARARSGMNGRVNAYSLRHTVAWWLRLQGVPAWEVATQLGHKFEGYSMTERYTADSPDYLEKACAALDLLLRQILQGESLARAGGVPERKIA